MGSQRTSLAHPHTHGLLFLFCTCHLCHQVSLASSCWALPRAPSPHLAPQASSLPACRLGRPVQGRVSLGLHAGPATAGWTSDTCPPEPRPQRGLHLCTGLRAVSKAEPLGLLKPLGGRRKATVAEDPTRLKSLGPGFVNLACVCPLTGNLLFPP